MYIINEFSFLSAGGGKSRKTRMVSTEEVGLSRGGPKRAEERRGGASRYFMPRRE